MLLPLLGNAEVRHWTNEFLQKRKKWRARLIAERWHREGGPKLRVRDLCLLDHSRAARLCDALPAVDALTLFLQKRAHEAMSASGAATSIARARRPRDVRDFESYLASLDMLATLSWASRTAALRACTRWL